MKNFEIRKVGEGSSTRTVYRNPDEELKRKIASFLPETETVDIGWPPTKWKVEERDGDEYRCTEGRNVKYFTVEEVEKARASQIENSRNRAYPAYKYFKDCFGVISKLVTVVSERENNGDFYSLEILNLVDGFSTGSVVGMSYEINPMSVEFYNEFYRYEIETYNKIGLEPSVSASSLCLHFTPEGDFVNRDYNKDFSKFQQGVISPTVALEALKKMLFKKVGNGVTKSKGKFYTDKFCFVPYNRFHSEHKPSLEFGFYVVPVRSDGKSYQVYTGDTIYRKPANLEQSSREEMWSYLMNMLTPAQECLLSDDFLNWKQYLPKEKIEIEN